MNPHGLELREVSVVSPSGQGSGERLLLDHISLRIAPGEWVQIAGPNGSGKSTLVKLLTGQLDRNCTVTGEIGGVFSAETYPYVLQHPETGIVGATPWEDLLLGLEQRGTPAELASALMERIFAQTRLTAIRHRPVAEMSGGQQQLTAIASCLAAEPPLLVLDEPTSMLDPVSRTMVLTVVRELHRAGLTVIWVTHRLQEWESGDRVIALERGRLVYDGGPDGFYYSDEAQSVSLCDRFGWTPPYAVRTAIALRRHGIRLSPLPLNAEQLARAVAR